jgi:hypothetical protein
VYKIKAINTKTKQIETYYCSDSVPLEEFKESLSYIKHGYPRSWERVKREIIEVEENITLTFRNEMKYVTTINEDSIKEIFLFEKDINHDWFYEVVGHMDDQFRRKSNAGFTNGLSCYGRSETLNLDSNSEDFELTKNCIHENNGTILLSSPPQFKCIKCNATYKV